MSVKLEVNEEHHSDSEFETPVPEEFASQTRKKQSQRFSTGTNPLQPVTFVDCSRTNCSQSGKSHTTRNGRPQSLGSPIPYPPTQPECKERRSSQRSRERLARSAPVSTIKGPFPLETTFEDNFDSDDDRRSRRTQTDATTQRRTTTNKTVRPRAKYRPDPLVRPMSSV